jgi:glucose-6-phosphate 1-dehydrogenase
MHSSLAIVILGASGDLARRKLIPALARLHYENRLPAQTIIVGAGRGRFTHEEFRAKFGAKDEFAQRIFYHQGISGLKDFVCTQSGNCRIVFFLALPPAVYIETAQEIRNEGFGKECAVVLEKPFGYDFATARKLNLALAASFSDEQIYRIDHYLAKEAVQNILVFRFANSVFQPVWNSANVESIQINAMETIGVEDRGAYFDTSGIIRDMVQNHIMQLLCLVTMEPPVSLDAFDIRTRKCEVLRTCKILQCLKAQYEGYGREKGVMAGSTTETFTEIEMRIDNMRWAGVPVFIRTGKKMDRRGTEIGVRFKRLPKVLFNANGLVPSNQVIFKIQPAEGIVVDISAKVPGSDNDLIPSKMNFCYRDAFADEIPEAYQKLLLDALNGDHTLFVGAEETELSWKIFDNFLAAPADQTYSAGTVPRTRLGAEWIDFSGYSDICK